jgi:hypothetical protein
MRTKRPLALLTPAIVLEVASHMAMGVALGLGFAFILTHIAGFGIGPLIDLGADRGGSATNRQMALRPYRRRM